jgi:multiple antibiotic resistance protein
MMEKLFSILPNTFIPLFVAMDIFWLLPIFTSSTEGLTAKKRSSIIRQSIITALVVSLIFTAIGEFVFDVIGITVDDFKVAGGLLLLVLAIRDLTSLGSKGIIEPSETAGVVPLAVPLIVGPAVLTTIIVLTDHYGVFPTVVALVLNLIVVWFSLAWARHLIGFLGKNGVAALSKIMAILLASISVMMIRLGIEGILGRV